VTDELLVYGSYGYVGSLVAQVAVEEGESPVLAGRRAERVEAQATELGLDHRTFSLEYPEVVEDNLEEFDAVLNCAGPYSATAGPLVEACVRTGTDYLDLDGQVDVLESTADRGAEAAEAGVTLLPAVGLDVAATDCLAAHLADQVEDPVRLFLAMDGLGTFSPGTVKSMIDGLDRPGVVREDGELRTVPMGWKTRDVEFDGVRKRAVTVPWGNVSTASDATGVQNVETYATVPEFAIQAMHRTRRLVPLLEADPVNGALQRLVDAVVSGPTAAERGQSLTRIFGQVESDSGERAAARLRVPDTYDFTARSAIESARRVLDGEVDDGYVTPARAFGPDYVFEFPGVERRDVDPSREEATVAER
jgi:short subunit dehydrogenase-like uncharacterized protein